MNKNVTKHSSALARRLAFFKGLQKLNERIHETSTLDEIIFDMAQDICDLFGAEKLLVFLADETGHTLQLLVKGDRHLSAGRNLPVSEKSVAGFCALHARVLNIPDLNAEEALRRISPTIEPLRGVEELRAHNCRQLLLAPLMHTEGSRLIGVVELINTLDGKPFSSIEEEGLLALAQTLAIAVAQRTQKAVPPLRSRFYQLVLRGLLTEVDLERTAEEARKRDVAQDILLIESFHLSMRDLGEAMAAFYGVPYEPFKPDRIKPMSLLRNIKREYAMLNGWLPLEDTQEGIVILAVDPERLIGSRVVLNVFQNTRLAYCVTTETEFEQTVAQYFDQTDDEMSVGDLLSDMADGDEQPLASEEISAASDNELVKLVNRIIVDAHRQGASDIHIEPRPGKEKLLVRFRKDGLLVPYIEVPAAYRNPMVARIKIMCELDVAERRKPQDGKIKFRKFGPLDIELRVATIPTAGGLEDIVMRLLSLGETMPIDKLALSEHNMTRLTATITKPYGIFFVCGPTGSGKTTTLHSILRYINKPETKIWTAEDPVEITQRGLRQVQINRKTGLDFPTVMRAFLRADPDVIMVGEMRDSETTQIGIEASLTGHLVFSTLHTNSAPESIVRLLDLGMDPFNFADALLGVLAQRLARRLCPHCRESVVASDDEIVSLLDEYCEDLRKTREYRENPEAIRNQILAGWRAQFGDDAGQIRLNRPVGCQECNQNGYRGRIGLHELMLGSDSVRRLIQTRALMSDLLVTAIEEGMRTLRQDGIEKVLAGETDMAQVRKVCIR